MLVDGKEGDGEDACDNTEGCDAAGTRCNLRGEGSFCLVGDCGLTFVGENEVADSSQLMGLLGMISAFPLDRSLKFAPFAISLE